MELRIPRTREELIAYYAHLEATIEREPIMHTGPVTEIRKDIAQLKQQIRKLGLEVPPFDDQILEMWRPW